MTIRFARPAFSLAAAPLLALLLVGCAEEPPPQGEIVRPVKAMKIAGFADFSSRSFPGKAKATQEVDLAFDVEGTLVERPVNIGDEVEVGQLVAKVDQRDFLARVKAAEAELAKHTANFERAKELIKDDFISKTDYDKLEAAKEVADSELLVASKALSDSVLKAPFDGVITNLYVENFQAVRPKAPVARLVDNSRIEFVINIPEHMISLVPQVQNLRVRFDAFRDIEIPAQVKEVGKEASEATRTYPVNLIMEQPEGVEILPGMAGIATGAQRAAGDDKQRVTVPVTAVFSPEATDQSFVWIIDAASQRVARRPVGVDSLADTGVVVGEGLQPGDWIAIAGVHYLKEGQKVSILEGPED